MNSDTHHSSRNHQKLTEEQESGLMSLVELQDFLNAELAGNEVLGGAKRAFTPLSDGLGLESPRQAAPQVKIPLESETLSKMGNKNSSEENRLEPSMQSAFQSAYQNDDEYFQFPKTEENKKPQTSSHRSGNSLASVIEAPVPNDNQGPLIREIETMPSIEAATQSATTAFPPPLPRPSALRRLLAGIMDQIFVLLLWTFALLLTSNILSGFKTGFSVQMLADFSKPFFQRMAALEFAAVWFGYLGFSLLIFSRTFGMWVWGISVSFGDSDGESHFMRKIMRVVWGFIFTAPVVTSFLLVIRRNGRNILDVLSGTNVYDAS